jgi:hypothetical protein
MVEHEFEAKGLNVESISVIRLIKFFAREIVYFEYFGV